MLKKQTLFQSGFVYVLLSGLLLGSANADLMGEGYGANSDEALKRALAALSESLIVEIKSESKDFTSSSGEKYSERDIRTLSDMPLIGVKTEVVSEGNESYHARVVLNSNSSIPLYNSQIKTVFESLNSANTKLSTTKSAIDRHALLMDMLASAEQFKKLATVARLLGVKNIPVPKITLASIKTEIKRIEGLAPNLDIAAKLLTRELPGSRVYIYPATPHDSHEVTAFSRLLRDKISTQIPSAEKPELASYFLRGEYEILADRMRVLYRLTDSGGNTMEVRTAALAPSAYKNIQYQTKVASFDKLLHQGVVLSGDFRVNVTTNRGSDDLMFLDGDELELLVKLNRSGYFYAVSHLKNDNEDESYLVELSEEKSARRFVRYVGADDANRWISLGKFNAGSPFGVESLQIIASTADLAYKLPPHMYDENADLYRLTAKDVNDGILRTRGLRPKRNPAKNIESAEAVMTMTIMPK